MAATPLVSLAERARAAGEEPWLFYRDRLDWEWRSWARVADQVARGAEALRAVSAEPCRIGFDARQHPDAVAASLAIQAAGHLAVPVRGGVDQAPAAGCDAWAAVGAGAGPGPGMRSIELPPARSMLEKTELRPLVPEPESAGALEVPGCRRLSPAELASSARDLDRRLPASADRPIVCAAPELDEATLQRLAAWTLNSGAAWVHEAAPEAFVETVLWARPTLVWAPPARLERLASRMTARKHRRHSRLSAVVTAGGIDPGPWTALGAMVVELDENRAEG